MTISIKRYSFSLYSAYKRTNSKAAENCMYKNMEECLMQNFLKICLTHDLCVICNIHR